MIGCVSMELALMIDDVEEVTDIIKQYSKGTTNIYYSFSQGKNGRRSRYYTQVRFGTDGCFSPEDYVLLENCIETMDLDMLYEDEFNKFIESLKNQQIDFEVYEIKKPQLETGYINRTRDFK